jgi:hypothetical protein
MSSTYRTLATLTEFLGAKLGANGRRHPATSDHTRPSLPQFNSPLGITKRCLATHRICFGNRILGSNSPQASQL